MQIPHKFLRTIVHQDPSVLESTGLYASMTSPYKTKTKTNTNKTETSSKTSTATSEVKTYADTGSVEITDSQGNKKYVGYNPVSDIRYKENIEQVGLSSSNIPIYEFDYKNKNHGNQRYSGVMAQDLLNLGFSNAVSKDKKGYYKVNYNLIDVDFKTIN
jgi:hypothetical protein